MRIAIAAPIEVNSLKQHLPDATSEELELGLGGTAVNLLIDGLINEGHHIIVYSLDTKIRKKYVLNGPNLKIVFGHFRATSKVKWFDFCYQEWRQIRQFILEETEEIDIINAHWSYEFAIGTILAKVPHVITFRDNARVILKLSNYHPYRFFRLLMDYWVRKNGNFFTFNSKYLQDKIKLKGTRIFPIIPNPLMDNIISSPRKYPYQKKTIDICFVANGWSYIKNPENALLAFKRLIKKVPTARFYMIGSGYEPNNKRVLDFMCKNNIDFVNLLGKLTHNELISKLNQFDILLHSSREESFGNNLIEAMAAGIPVVGGINSGAVPWILENGKSGILVNIEVPEQITEALLTLIHNKEVYERISINAYESVVKRFTSRVISKAYTNYFKEVLRLYGSRV